MNANSPYRFGRFGMAMLLLTLPLWLLVALYHGLEQAFRFLLWEVQEIPRIVRYVFTGKW